jgi:DnaJ family protein B protein 12
VVSKAFQILSDNDLRGVYDSNPNGDPTQRGGGGGGFPGGGMRGFNGARGNPGFHGGMQGEVSPEDLFNMFFGGGGMGGGGGGFGNGSPFGPRGEFEQPRAVPVAVNHMRIQAR